jgi:DNA topoisomerase IB
MAFSYRTDIFLKKLYYIHEQCASAREAKKKADAEANMDAFARMRKKIASDIRHAKSVRSNPNHNLAFSTLFETSIAEAWSAS